MAENIPPVVRHNEADRCSGKKADFNPQRKSTVVPKSWPVSATVLSLMYFGSLLTSVFLLFASLNTWEFVSKSEKIAEKVQEIEKFERRLSDRLDVFNAGIQNLLQDANSRISVLESTMQKSEVQQRELIADLRRLANEIESRVSSFSSTAPLIEVNDVTRSVKKPEPEARQNPTSSFRRIDNADGSVSYEKVR